MKKLLLFFFFFSTFTANSQENSFDENKATKEFLRQFMNDSLGKYIINEKGQSECGIYVSKLLSVEETSLVNEKLSNDHKDKWKIAPLPNVEILSDSTFYKINKDEILEDEKKHILIISKPIFIQKARYCVFYYMKFWGNRGGKNELALYENENGKWLKKEEFCSGMN